MSSKNSSVIKSIGIVGASAALSRILGFIRDVMIARYFGAGFYSDAFFAAFRIPDFLRRLLMEGSLSMAFVSVFTEYLVKDGKKQALNYAGSALKFLSVVLAIVSISGVLLSPLIVRLLAPGFAGNPDKLSLTILLTKIMFPYIFFVGIVAFCMGILNALDHFAAPALSPVFLNLAMIGSMLWISPHMENPVAGLAVGVIIGGILQLALQAPFLIKRGVLLFAGGSIFHAGLKKVGALMFPMIFGAAAYQVNIFIGTFLASFLEEGSISYLYYAELLVQFPLGMIAVSTSSVVLPTLSKQAMSKDFVALKKTFSDSLKLVFYITIPAMAGLVVLRNPILTLLFKRGEFDARSVQLTAQALFYYGIGIWAFAGIRIVLSTYYAMLDTKTPLQTAVISIIFNVLLGAIFMIPLGFCGIALSASISSILNFCILLIMLNKKLRKINWKSIGESVAKTVAGAIIMAMVVGEAAKWIIPLAGNSTYFLFIGLLIIIMIGMSIFMFYSFIIRHEQFQIISNQTKKGISKP
jgi:putative peptidoglycan lipid II flippase